MSGARKLQTEIDRVMKKVDEGVELFDEIWEKVYSAEQQNQKEKYEVDLKKEIKKLQRLRDQIKTWIGSSDVKDKDALLHARRLIETKMEQFKVCEKETKTKTYSKEGLARQEKLSPEEEAKENTCKWIAEIIEQLNQLVDERDVEIERLSTGKGKKSNKHIIDEYNDFISNHKYHISKLEGIMRLVMNDRLPADLVNELKEDLEYYVEAHEDDEYIQGYDEEIFYETLGLDEMDVVNVDRVTQAPSVTSKKSMDGDASSSVGSTKKDSKKSSKKSSTASSMIPLTIGRARNSAAKAAKEITKDSAINPAETMQSPAKRSTSSGGNSVSSGSSLGPTARAPPPPNHSSGASMAAVLKREGEQQEKERQKQVALQQAQQQRLLQEQQARAAQAEQLRQQQQQQLLRQQQEQLQRQQQQQQQEAVLRQQKEAQEKAAAMQEAAVRQQQLLVEQQQHRQQQQQAEQQKNKRAGGGGAIDLLLHSGLGGLSLGNMDTTTITSNNNTTTNNNNNISINGGQTPSSSTTNIITPSSSTPQPSATAGATTANVPNSAAVNNYDATASYLGALNESFLHCPSNVDSERSNTYNPRNPYPTPASYPSAPSTIFDNPAVFEKLGTDGLFFIFYYAQGTYHQYLAARELKKQSWRYHKKYMTWFQRHEEPKVTTDEYEQGTYVYFDYETGWCQRIKSDFRFEYSYLEDSLQI